MRQLEHPVITQIRLTGYGFKSPEPTADVYELTERCSYCGDLISEQQSAYRLCATCEAKAWDRFRTFIFNEFTDAERAYLDACIEGHSLTEIEKIQPLKAIY